MSTMPMTIKIGDVARLADVTVDTVRFYERRGLLPPAERRPSGYRIYTDATVERIRFARSLQTLSFTLDEIIEVLSSVDKGTATCENQAHRFEIVLARIDRRIAELQATRRKAVHVLDRCRTGSCTLREEH